MEITVTLEDPTLWKDNTLPSLPTHIKHRYSGVWDRSEGLCTNMKDNGLPFYKFKHGMQWSHLPGTRLELGKGQPHPQQGPCVIETWHAFGDEN